MKLHDRHSLLQMPWCAAVGLALAILSGPTQAHPEDPPAPPPDIGAPTTPNPPSHKRKHIHTQKSLGPVAMPKIPTQPQFPIARVQSLQEKEARLKSKKK